MKSTHYKLSIQKGWSWRRGFQIDLRKKFTTKHGERKNGCSVKSDPKRKKKYYVQYIFEFYPARSLNPVFYTWKNKYLPSRLVMPVLWHRLGRYSFFLGQNNLPSKWLPHLEWAVLFWHGVSVSAGGIKPPDRRIKTGTYNTHTQTKEFVFVMIMITSLAKQWCKDPLANHIYPSRWLAWHESRWKCT